MFSVKLAISSKKFSSVGKIACCKKNYIKSILSHIFDQSMISQNFPDTHLFCVEIRFLIISIFSSLFKLKFEWLSNFHVILDFKLLFTLIWSHLVIKNETKLSPTYIFTLVLVSMSSKDFMYKKGNHEINQNFNT